MRLCKDEFTRLKIAKDFTHLHFPGFGVNKKREITRLIYEISKREDIIPQEVLGKSRFRDYHQLKDRLLKLRYPEAFSRGEQVRPFLPVLTLKKQEVKSIKSQVFSPQKLFIEKRARNSELTRNFQRAFPRAKVIEIPSLKQYRCEHRHFTLGDYNKRRESVFIVHEVFDFLKVCPCTKSAQGCGYYVLNLGFGCIFECTYCYLQAYSNSYGIVLPANIESYFRRLTNFQRNGVRIGTGEFSDSLALDDITQYSRAIIDYFKRNQKLIFEFKTKSVHIENVMQCGPAQNIVVSWSLNPARVIRENEFFSASLEERLSAASMCAHAGFKVGFHFDPVVYFKGWQKEYKALIERLMSMIKPGKIAWISIGMLRLSPKTKQIMERRFPKIKLLDEELLLDFDAKLRYPPAVRFAVYRELISEFRKYSRALKLYICMEEASMWSQLRISMPSAWRGVQ